MTKGYECRECFTSKPASFPTGSKQSWLNIHVTMAAPSHFLLGNKAPGLHSVFFWASAAAVTTALPLPLRLCINSADSSLVKWQDCGPCGKKCIKGESPQKTSLIMTNKWLHAMLPAHWSRVKVEKKKKKILMACAQVCDKWEIHRHETGPKKVFKLEKRLRCKWVV